MNVDRLIEDVAEAICAKSGWEDRARAALGALGLPLETLAALKAGAWKAVPVVPADDMASPLTRLWLMADQEPTAEDMQCAREYAAAMLAAAPAKPGDAE